MEKEGGFGGREGVGDQPRSFTIHIPDTKTVGRGDSLLGGRVRG